MVSCGPKFVIFTSIKWQGVPWVLFSFAPYSSALPLLVDLSRGSQWNVSVCRSVHLPKERVGPGGNKKGDQHRLYK